MGLMNIFGVVFLFEEVEGGEVWVEICVFGDGGFGKKDAVSFGDEELVGLVNLPTTS